MDWEEKNRAKLKELAEWIFTESGVRFHLDQNLPQIRCDRSVVRKNGKDHYLQIRVYSGEIYQLEYVNWFNWKDREEYLTHDRQDLLKHITLYLEEKQVRLDL